MGSLSNRKHLSSQDKLKIRENEKFDRTYQNWQQAKVETKQSNLSHFKERVALQHSLIRAQDELASIKRDEEQKYREEKRSAEKTKKHARDQALLNICRQSLDDDRKSVRAKSWSGSRNEKPESSPNLSSESTSPIKPFITEQIQCNSLTDSVSPFMRRTLSPFVDENEEEDRSDKPTLTRKLSPSLPWHHAQLYHLYGDKADYFLHPKIEPKPQKQIHPKLRNKEDGAGAEALWTGLRSESMTRLRRYDRHVPKELKLAFSAFVRQSLRKNIPLVQRNFCTVEDVPEMPQLLDKTELQKTQAYRHKLQIMHRSSLTNADRTKVLTYNNPIPDLNNLDGGDSIDRYLPSWAEADNQISEADFQEWRQPALENCGSNVDKYEGEDDNHEKTLKYLEYPKLKFMTESEPKSNGGFSVKFQDKEKFQTQMSETTDAGGVTKGEDTSVATDTMNQEEKEDADKQRILKQRSDPRFVTKWEPLSMNALVEYSKEVSIHGRGGFTYAQSNVWNRELTT